MVYPEYEEALSELQDSIEFDGFDRFSQQYPFDVDLESFLEGAERGERERIEDELEKIDRRLERREEIHEEAVDSIQRSLQDEQNRLDRLSRPFAPAERKLEQQRRISELEQRLDREHRSLWQDCEDLEEERRRLKRELNELIDSNLSTLL